MHFWINGHVSKQNFRTWAHERSSQRNQSLLNSMGLWHGAVFLEGILEIIFSLMAILLMEILAETCEILMSFQIFHA